MLQKTKPVPHKTSIKLMFTVRLNDTPPPVDSQIPSSKGDDLSYCFLKSSFIFTKLLIRMELFIYILKIFPSESCKSI